MHCCSIASHVRGTTANLRKNDYLTVEQLLYGAMLPSGNDAAFALAKYFGRRIFEYNGWGEEESLRIQSYQFNYHPYYVKYFLKEMNELAQQLKLSNTHFDSPHGLMNVTNLSTAYDMGRLASKCMQIPLLRKVCASKYYMCHPKKKCVSDSTTKYQHNQNSSYSGGEQ